MRPGPTWHGWVQARRAVWPAAFNGSAWRHKRRRHPGVAAAEDVKSSMIVDWQKQDRSTVCKIVAQAAEPKIVQSAVLAQKHMSIDGASHNGSYNPEYAPALTILPPTLSCLFCCGAPCNQLTTHTTGSCLAVTYTTSDSFKA